MRILLKLLVAVLLTAAYASAQDRPLNSGRAQSDRQTDKAGGGKSVSAASASSPTAAEENTSSSPFPTPTPTDTRFVVDADTGLDTGCTFRSEGSLKFKVKVKRYFGQLNSDGTLTHAQALVNNGVLSEYATLKMPSYDVDYSTPPAEGHHPERDRVLFNGVPIGNLDGDAYLRGINDTWIMNEFQVPINLVHFGQKGENGDEPSEGENEIEILIDQANAESGAVVWCTAIDWASLSFKALAPVIMVHGNNSSGSFFTQFDFTEPFEEKKIPFDNAIDMETDTIQEHGEALGREIPAKARQFGAHSVHIIAHSKGGLDTREFLAHHLPENFGVLSFTTLSTPHHGSVLADYSVVSKRGSWLGTLLYSDNRALAFVGNVWRTDKGRADLTVDHVNNSFNPENEPKLPRELTVDGQTERVHYFSYGADANLNDSYDLFGKPTITSVFPDETRGSCGFVTHVFCEAAYAAMGNVAAVTLEPKIVLGVTIGHGVKEWPTQTFQFNDFLVTVKSSRLQPLFLPQPDRKDNHATIANDEVGRAVLNLIRLSQPIE
jgi:hypothetical protein